MRMTNPKSNMPLVKNPPRAGNPMGTPIGKPGIKMAMGGTVKARPTSPGGVSAVRPGESYAPGMGKKFSGMTLRPGEVTNKLPRVPPGMTAPTGMAAMVGNGLSQQAAAQASLDKMKMGARGMKKGGMATKKKAGKISEYGGKEMYSSKKGMMKHEGMESMKMEKSEGMKMRGGGMAAKGKGLAMKKGGMAPKGRGMAIMIAIGKPKGRGK